MPAERDLDRGTDTGPRAREGEGVLYDGDVPLVDDGPAPPSYDSPAEHLEDELRLCDALFERAPAVIESAAPRLAGPPAAESAGDAAVRLRQAEARVERMRARIDARVLSTPDAAARLPAVRLARAFRLDPVGLQSILVLLAVELDHERLAALAARPDRDTPPPTHLSPGALHHIVGSLYGEAPQRWLTRFTGEHGLIAQRLVLAVAPGRPISATPLVLNPRLVSYLLDQPGLEGGLRPFVARLAPSAGGPPPLPGDRELARALHGRRAAGHCLWLLGPEGHGARDAAAALAAAAGLSALALDLDALAAASAEVRDDVLAALHLEQRLGPSALVVDWAARQRTPELALRALATLQRLGETAGGPLITLSEDVEAGLASVLAGALYRTLPPPDTASRAGTWREQTRRFGAELSEEGAAALAREFTLGLPEIARVVTGVARSAHLTATDLREACVRLKAGRLRSLAELVVTPFEWSDLVLPAESMAELRRIVAYQQQRQTVLEEWGMARKLPYGAGLSSLFSGPPGTGKTMAASVVANALGRELHRVDLSRVVDKYIGETEKNIARIFDAAEDAHAVLLFDEADALFAKRTGVSSSHDRYANIETNFLLQRVESYNGISILTTNRVGNIDEAFMRRLRAHVQFPLPDAAGRALLWRKSLADRVPRGDDINWDDLGAAFDFSGGNIKSAALRAAFTAAAAARPLVHADLAEAAVAECRALGKVVRATRGAP